MPTLLPHPNKILKGSDKSTTHDTLIAQFGDGYAQAAANGLNSEKETWNITYAPLEGTELTDLQTFLSAVGSHGIVEWTTFLDTSPKYFRVVVGSEKSRLITPQKLQISFTLAQTYLP